jgi:hypothetical protein
MTSAFWPATEDIRAVFTEEVAAAGGTVSDTFDDGTRLFLRSLLPAVDEVRPRDQMQAGVALLANDNEVRVHPYLFRQVCRNGAIVVHALQTRRLERADFPDTDEAVAEVTGQVREAVQVCCEPEAFTTALSGVRSAAEREADMTLQLLPMLARLPQATGAQIVADIHARFAREGDHSVFGLMNAVTSLARDTRDPELRWRLEELGGGIPAARQPMPMPDSPAARQLVAC